MDDFDDDARELIARLNSAEPDWHWVSREILKLIACLDEADDELEEARARCDKAHGRVTDMEWCLDEAHAERDAAIAERDEARAELSALRTEVLRAELDERVRHERADDARAVLEALRAERDEARAALATQRALWGNIGPETYQTWLRDRDALVAKQTAELEAMRAERDEARAGLTALVAAYEGEEGTCLGFQAAVARALVKAWRAK